MQRPDDDADDWDRATLLAEDLARVAPIGERQAQVYAADRLGIDMDITVDRLDISESNYYSTLYDAQDRVDTIRHGASMLDRHPAVRESRSITDVDADDYDAMADEFDTAYRHDRADQRVGEQFAHGDNTLVTVRQTAGRQNDDGTPGYILTQQHLDTGSVSRRAVSADRLDELLTNGTLRPATADIALDVETDDGEEETDEDGNRDPRDE